MNNINMLKFAFSAIIVTLCIILAMLTLMVVFFSFDVEKYKSILEVLGIPTLFGMIVQSYIHMFVEPINKAQAARPVVVQEEVKQ